MVEDALKNPDVLRFKLPANCFFNIDTPDIPILYPEDPEFEKRRKEGPSIFAEAVNRLGPAGMRAILPEIERQAREWFQSNFIQIFPSRTPAPGGPAQESTPAKSATTPAPARVIEPPVEPQKNEPPQMAPQEETITITKDGTLLKGGVPYRSLSDAAPLAQTHRTTLLNWIKNKIPFAGRPLQSYHFAPANRYFLSEESIQRAANRFVKWPSEEPAGPVTIGETRDKTGYIGIPKAAHILGVDHHTMWLWTAPRPSEHRPSAHATAPTDKPLDVIKDPASEQIYIREKDIARLKKLIPRSGLKRGRRPQVGTPHP